MKRRKPAGWPKYMVARRLASGGTGYYWAAPTWAKKAGCAIANEALGTDYSEAKKRRDELLNPQFDAWNKVGEPGAAEEAKAAAGTFDWMISIYKASPQYKTKAAKTRKSYDAAASLVADYILKNGSRFGSLKLKSITPEAADKLFAALKTVKEPVLDDKGEPTLGKDGKPVVRMRERTRTAIGAMVVCRRAWFIARRSKPTIVPLDNPFSKMGLKYKAKSTKPVSYESLMRFVKVCDEAGDYSVGTAAMIAFFWLQREIDILSRFSWAHYRPAEAPDMARIWHHKTGELVDLPLYDEDGTALWPELVERLDGMERRGTLVVMRDRPDRRRKIHLPWKEDYFRHVVADHRKEAGLDPEEKFMGLRHGGNTEGADAELTDAQLRALSGHKTADMTILYAKKTIQQRRVGARKRLQARTKRGDLSK
jgi:hypothetical protein